MVRNPVEQLKADAFTLSKILATCKVKLSSQQCLDVLAKLHWNVPYEAVLAQAPERKGTDEPTPRTGELNTLEEWLACATSFCDLVKTLDREGVNQAAWNGHEVPDGLHWDGRTYLRAAGVAADCFSRAGEQFVRSDLVGRQCRGLKLSVESGEPVVEGQLAVMRIQSTRGAASTKRAQFVGIGKSQLMSEPILFGAEGRICLTTHIPDHNENGPHQMVPGLRLTYEVVSQLDLKAFASLLEMGALQKIWALAPFDVETSILITRDSRQDSIEEKWKTADDPAGKRLMAFCATASKMSGEETCDWPPYLRLTASLDAKSTQDDLDMFFSALCAHALCLGGDSGGWHEIIENFKQADPQGYDEMRNRKAVGKMESKR